MRIPTQNCSELRSVDCFWLTRSPKKTIMFIRGVLAVNVLKKQTIEISLAVEMMFAKII